MRHTEGTFVTTDGLTLFHQAWLPDAEPHAVVLLLHGLGEHSGRYAHVAAALTGHGWAVRTFDLRGHGRSPGKRAFVRSYDELLGDIVGFRALVEREHPGLPLVVLGHSMGGNLALAHVLDHQHGVAALVLSAPALAVGDDFSPVQLKLFKALARVAPGLRPRALDSNSISRDPAVVAAYRNDPLVYSGKISLVLGAALIGSMQRLPERHAELRIPLLLLHGTEDRLTDIAGTRELEAGAVNARVTTHYYDGLYHEIFNEPEQADVIGDLLAWLDAVLA